MHIAPIIQDLALILICAATVATLFHRLRQPVVVGYLLAGALVGPNSLLPHSPVSDLPNIRVWAEIGVIFLMFHLGLEFSFARFRRLGLSIVGIGLAEVSLMLAAGWLVGRAAGFDTTEALFLGAVISISSTTIILKAFDEFNLKTRRFAETVLGILIVEDLLAVLLLVWLGTPAFGTNLERTRLLTLAPELFIVIGAWVILGSFLVPRFMRYVGRFENDEILTLLATGLCLLLAVTAVRFHYSTALGAFIMGAIIGETKESKRVAHLIHPMRDVFAAIFFVSAGMLADFRSLMGHLPLVFGIATIVIAGKFVAILTSTLIAGQPFRTSLQAALSMGQIGEFSFIIASLGIATGTLQPEFQAIIVATSLVTSLSTAYLVRGSEPLARALEDRLPRGFKTRLVDYAAWMAVQKQRSHLPRWLRPGLGRWLINAIWVAALFGLHNHWLKPWMETWLTDHSSEQLLARSASFCVALLLAAPFIYAMLSAARPSPTPASQAPLSLREKRARSFLYLFLSTLWLGLLSSQYLSAFASASITLALVALLAAVFLRRLQISYAWIESQFLSGLAKEESASQKAMRDLAPWDAHLVSAVVHPNSALMGLPLSQSGLRERFGLIIVAIRRGDRIIGMPPRTELLLPHDELLLLGTDEQIESARLLLESATRARDIPSSDFSDFVTKALIIHESSPLSGRSILESKLRESHGALIVGVERDSRRWIAPPPNFRIQKGDILWLAGQRARLAELT